jgi:hypothetical protein
MADTHFYNNIRYFCNFKLSISIAITGDSKAEIYGYDDINLAIKVGKQRLTQYLILRNIAYTPYFYINLISAAKLYKVGVIINQFINYLRYKDDGSLFANFIKYKSLYFINTIATLPPTFTAYATSTKFFIILVYDKVWHQCLLHCDIELVEYLLTAVDGVKVVKMDKGRTLYSIPLYKPCVLRKIT